MGSKCEKKIGEATVLRAQEAREIFKQTAIGLSTGKPVDYWGGAQALKSTSDTL
jgi:hypothetical protein